MRHFDLLCGQFARGYHFTSATSFALVFNELNIEVIVDELDHGELQFSIGRRRAKDEAVQVQITKDGQACSVKTAPYVSLHHPRRYCTGRDLSCPHWGVIPESFDERSHVLVCPEDQRIMVEVPYHPFEAESGWTVFNQVTPNIIHPKTFTPAQEAWLDERIRELCIRWGVIPPAAEDE